MSDDPNAGHWSRQMLELRAERDDLQVERNLLASERDRLALEVHYLRLYGNSFIGMAENEREWAAAREIERLAAELAEAKVNQREVERFLRDRVTNFAAELAEARDEVARLKAGLQQVTRVSQDTSISSEVLRRELLAIVEYALKIPPT